MQHVIGKHRRKLITKVRKTWLRWRRQKAFLQQSGARSKANARFSVVVSMAASTFFFAAAQSSAQSSAPEDNSVRDFYRGKQITFTVSSGVGTGFDAAARVIARFLPKYLPGRPGVIVENMPGAGGVQAANWLYKIAPKNGLSIGMLTTNVAFNPLFGDTSTRFSAEKFNWLGSPSKETALFIVWHTSPINSVADIGDRVLTLASTGATSTPAIYARLLAYVLNLKFKIISGYQSLDEGLLAMERGEIDGNTASYWSSLNAQKPSWIRDHQIKILTYFGADRMPEIGAPYIFDLIKDEDRKKVMEIGQAGLAMGRPIVAPPDLEPRKLAALQKAFDQVFKDPDYLAACTQAHLECSNSSSGTELLALVKSIYAQPESAIKKVSEIFSGANN